MFGFLYSLPTDLIFNAFLILTINVKMFGKILNFPLKQHYHNPKRSISIFCESLPPNLIFHRMTFVVIIPIFRLSKARHVNALNQITVGTIFFNN